MDIGLIAEKLASIWTFETGNAEFNYYYAAGERPAAESARRKRRSSRGLLADSSAPPFRYDIYTVKSGDSLSVIARRYSRP